MTSNGIESFGVKLGRLVRQRREAYEYSQEELAAHADCSHKTISKLELGQIDSPRGKTVSAICGVLEITPEEQASLMPPIQRPAKALEQSEKSSAKPKRHSFPLPPFIIAISVFSGIIVPVIMLIGYFEYTRQQSLREAEALNEQFQESLRPQPIIVPSADEITPRPRFSASMPLKRMELSSSFQGIPDGVKAEISLDGETFSENRTIESYLPEHKFLVRLTSEQWAGERLFDFTTEAHAAVTRALERIRWDCNTDRCQIHTNLCASHWSKVTFGRTLNAEETEIEFRDICSSQGTLEPMFPCFAYPNNLIPLRPSQTLNGRLYSASGEYFSFSFVTDRQWEVQSKSLYLELPASNPASSAEAPYAIAWYDGAFKVRLSIFGCGKYGAIQSDGDYVDGEQFSIFFDADGKGFQSARRIEFSIPTPQRDVIEIKFQSADGKLHGPFQYAISVDEIMNRAVRLAPKINKVSCRNWKIDGEFLRACRPDRFGMAPDFDWTNVKSIRFGEKPDSLSQNYEIDLNVATILERFDLANRYDLKPLFDYRPSENADKVYFEITFKNGSKSPIERIDLM